MYSFLRRPKWIISHILVLASIVLMINLAMWQGRRLTEKKDLNAKITARADITPAPVADILGAPGSMTIADGIDVEFRSVVVSGTYDLGGEFTVPNRTFNGAPGRFVVTPLHWSTTHPDILVLRGFIPQSIEGDTAPVKGIEPPTGQVSLRGWLRMSQLPEGIQSKTAELGNNRFARIDIARIEQATGRKLAPVYFELERQEPPTTSKMITEVPLPERSEGPHLSYELQWAFFTMVAVVGYPLIIRKVARGQRELDDDTHEMAGPPQKEPDIDV